MDILVSVKEGTSLAIISGNEIPIVEVNADVAVIASTTRSSATNIAARTGGELLDTPNKEFPFEIHIPLSLFDRVVEVDNWFEIISKYIE